MSGGPAFLHGVEELTVRLCYVNFDGEYSTDFSLMVSSRLFVLVNFDDIPFAAVCVGECASFDGELTLTSC